MFYSKMLAIWPDFWNANVTILSYYSKYLLKKTVT